MNLPLHSAATVLVAGLLFAIDSPDRVRLDQDGSPQAKSWDRYREIVDQNIFSRTRRPRRERSGPGAFEPEKEEAEKPAPPAGPEDPGRHFVLFGVSKIGERQFAFFENTRESAMVHGTTGDVIAERKLTAITLDHVQCEIEGKTVTVALGETLTGEEPSRVSSGASAPFSRGPGSGRGPFGPGRRPAGETRPPSGGGEGPRTKEEPAAGEQSVLERLLRRRREEGGN